MRDCFIDRIAFPSHGIDRIDGSLPDPTRFTTHIHKHKQARRLMEGKKEAAEVVWKAASSASASSAPPATTGLEADLICDDEKEALSQAALSAAAAARKMAAATARKAAAPAAAEAAAQPKFSTGSVGVAESKPGKRVTTTEAPPSDATAAAAATAATAVTAATAAAIRATTPTPTSFAFSSAPSSASRSPSPLQQHPWGPSFGIAAGSFSSKPSAPSVGQSPPSLSSSACPSPPASIPASVAAAASPPDLVAAALTAAGVAKRKWPGKDEDEDEASAASDRTSPWLLLEGSPTFGAKERPQLAAVTQEELREGATALLKRLRYVGLTTTGNDGRSPHLISTPRTPKPSQTHRTEASRTEEAHAEIRLLLNPSAATSS